MFASINFELLFSFTKVNGSPGPFDKNTPPISLASNLAIKSSPLKEEGTTSTSKPYINKFI